MSTGVLGRIRTWWGDDDRGVEGAPSSRSDHGPDSATAVDHDVGRDVDLDVDVDVALDDLELDGPRATRSVPEHSGVRAATRETTSDDALRVREESLVPAQDDWVAPRREAESSPSAEARAVEAQAEVPLGRPSSPTPIIEARWIEVDEPAIESEHQRPTRRVRLARVLAATLARTGSDD